MRLGQLACQKMLRYMSASILALALILVPPPLTAQAPEEVDVALVLAVDISFSMDLDELALQRNGYVQALKSPEVIRAIERGAIGKIAVAYFEWAGNTIQHNILPWTVIDGAASATAFAEKLAEAPTRRGRRTSISGAIDTSMKLFDEANVRPLKRVIDISGDGPNNDGRMVTIARDEALAKGVNINGLPVMLKTSSYMDLENLDKYYEECVIGGPGAFVIPIRAPAQFTEAVRTKLVLEISGLQPEPARIMLAQSGQAQSGQAQSRQVQSGQAPSVRPVPFNCAVGERQWRERWGN
jgi:Protein of unknown function (DUF1194)